MSRPAEPNVGPEAPPDVDEALFALFGGFRDDQDALMATVARLDEMAREFEAAFARAKDPKEREQIRACGLNVERARSYALELHAELLTKVAPTAELAEVAGTFRERARADRRRWDDLARDARLDRRAGSRTVDVALLNRAATRARESRPRRRGEQRSSGERSPPRRSSDPDDPDDLATARPPA